jgi:hypothetical protein
MEDKSGEDGSGRKWDELLPETCALLQHYCTGHLQLVRAGATVLEFLDRYPSLFLDRAGEEQFSEALFRFTSAVIQRNALFSAESRIDIAVDVMPNIRVNPAQQNNRTARTEGAHPTSLIGMNNGGDGRGPEIMRSLRMGLTPPHSVYVHRAGTSLYNRVEDINSALSARLNAAAAQPIFYDHSANAVAREGTLAVFTTLNVAFPPLGEEVD